MIATVDDDEALLDQAVAVFQEHGFDLVLAPNGNRWVAHIARQAGEIVVRSYANGPDRLVTAFAAEQRWRVEQDGSGSVMGDTYVDKVRERIRRLRLE